jgi:hypothetical protein
MLIVYFWTANNLDEELMQWSDIAPSVGDLIPGTDQPVGKVEFYRGDLETVCLAISRPVYGEGHHSFNVQLRPDQTIIQYGMSMEAKPPTGRLMNYETTSHPTLMRPNPSNWVVSEVETCNPVATGSYKAIHICYCVDAPLPVAV